MRLPTVLLALGLVGLSACAPQQRTPAELAPSDSVAIARDAEHIMRSSFALNQARKFDESFQWFMPSTTGAADGRLIRNWQEHRTRTVMPFLARLDSMSFVLGDVVVTAVTADVAVLVAKYSFSGVLDGRSLLHPSTVVTWVLRKRDQRWEIVHWHTSNP